MAVHDDEDNTPLEAPLLKKPKKYVVIKNHVRELLPDNEGLFLVGPDSKTTEKSDTEKRKVLKRKRELQKQLSTVSEPANVSESDLEELKTVYKKCKAVLQKIETKYGHLLNLEDNESDERSQNTSNDESSDYCSCSQKKKIVFDENGQQIEKDCVTENHICIKTVKKLKTSDSQHCKLLKPSVRIEYNQIPDLPDDIQELENILKDVNIKRSYRQMVIDKIYLLRQHYLNEIKLEKQDIIKQIKDKPDEVFEFKGTNLASLQGYPINVVKESENSTPSKSGTI